MPFSPAWCKVPGSFDLSLYPRGSDSATLEFLTSLIFCNRTSAELVFIFPLFSLTRFLTDRSIFFRPPNFGSFFFSLRVQFFCHSNVLFFPDYLDLSATIPRPSIIFSFGVLLPPCRSGEKPVEKVPLSLRFLMFFFLFLCPSWISWVPHWLGQIGSSCPPQRLVVFLGALFLQQFISWVFFVSVRGDSSCFEAPPANLPCPCVRSVVQEVPRLKNK